MNHPISQPETMRERRSWLPGILTVAVIGILAWSAWCWVGSRKTLDLVSVDRATLELRDGVWYVSGQAQPFTGYVLDHDQAGRLRVRSAVADGRLHGLSIGWTTNGVPELQETFRNGIPEGTRTTWYSSGRKRSEGWLTNGLQNGVYRQWDEAGTLVVEAEFLDGKPHGISRAWHPDGSLKAETLMQHGEVQVRHVYALGERLDPTALAGSSTGLNTVQSK